MNIFKPLDKNDSELLEFKKIYLKVKNMILLYYLTLEILDVNKFQIQF
jgi:hypothetical protein